MYMIEAEANLYVVRKRPNEGFRGISKKSSSRYPSANTLHIHLSQGRERFLLYLVHEAAEEKAHGVSGVDLSCGARS
jgi:hypothetical protein